MRRCIPERCRSPRLSTEFDRLEQMITGYGVQKVVLLGDLFHSQLNSDWQDFALFVRQHTTVEWLLTVGNHDIIPPEKYHETGILYAPEYRIGNSIICRHEPEQKGPRDMLQLTGHIHPGYTLHAAARMQYRFPCFYYDTPILTLPAFGGLTGLYPVEKNTHNRIFVVVEDAVKEVK